MHGDSGGPFVCHDSSDGKQKLLGWATEMRKSQNLLWYARLEYYKEWIAKKMLEVEELNPLRRRNVEKLSSARVGDLYFGFCASGHYNL